MRAAQGRFQHLVDRLRANVVPRIGQQLIVKDGLGAVERRQLDDIDQFARLDDAAHIGGIERLAGDLHVDRAQTARQPGLFDLFEAVRVGGGVDRP